MSKNKNMYSVLSNENYEKNKDTSNQNKIKKTINNDYVKSNNNNNINMNEITFGTIKNIVGYGIFVDVGIGFNGLLHVSQIGKVLKKHIWNPSDIYEINQQIPVKILNIDKKNQKILLELIDLKIKNNDKNVWKNISDLPIDMVKSISEKVNKNISLQFVNKNCSKLVNIENTISKFFENTQCSNTNNEILGLKIKIERYPNSNEISYITPLSEYISYSDYLKNDFSDDENEWIPVCIDEKNLYVIENQLAKIFGVEKFYVWMVMQIFPYMLNTIVVQEITEQKMDNTYFVRYLHIAHIFILFARKYPEIRRMSDKKISSFITNDWNRSKKSTPSIGALISTLIISENYTWLDLAHPSLNESFSRNVKWVLNHHPELVENIIIDSNRNEKTFKSTIGSLRLLMLHVGYQKIVKNNKNFWECYDNLKIMKGIPTTDIINEISEFRRNVYNTKNWDNFFNLINISIPKNNYLADWLRKSIIHSRKRRYHISTKNSQDNNEYLSDNEDTSIYDGIL